MGYHPTLPREIPSGENETSFFPKNNPYAFHLSHKFFFKNNLALLDEVAGVVTVLVCMALSHSEALGHSEDFGRRIAPKE